MISPNDEFTQFEYTERQRVAGKYDSVWSSLTRQFIAHLIGAAQVSSGMSVLDVACGFGYVSAAVKQLGDDGARGRGLEKLMRFDRSASPQV